ncbi:MAG: cytidylate kinase family protein [Syntrophaceae bacterium]|nr:cytidylate kinase family protein [Syntrophaceae bacterium]
MALLEAYIYEHASRDKAIVIGQGGSFVLTDLPFVLKIRLTAPFELRVRRRLMEKSRSARRRPRTRGARTRPASATSRPSTEGLVRPQELRHGLQRGDTVLRSDREDHRRCLRVKDRRSPTRGTLLAGRAIAAQIRPGSYEPEDPRADIHGGL